MARSSRALPPQRARSSHSAHQHRRAAGFRYWQPIFHRGEVKWQPGAPLHAWLILSQPASKPLSSPTVCQSPFGVTKIPTLGRTPFLCVDIGPWRNPNLAMGFCGRTPQQRPNAAVDCNQQRFFFEAGRGRGKLAKAIGDPRQWRRSCLFAELRMRDICLLVGAHY
jgi:hypothetical protein